MRGAVYPSPVVALSIVAVAMAGIAFVATWGADPTEREITRVTSTPQPEPRRTATSQKPAKPPKPREPAVRRAAVYVEVYNNSNVSGLAGRVADRATDAGWQVVGSDNWYGTITSSTVYHPKRLAEAARLLALDLGIKRTALAVDPMRLDRLTVILTGELR